jgi:DNA-binding response OmpR family regulator
VKHIVLIADRDAELGEVYGRFLARQGYAVETAAHGIECLDKLRRTTPSALVLDLELLWGGADGVLSYVREDRELANLPVILTATAARTAVSGADLASPAVAFCPKPFSLAALLETVRSAIARKLDGELSIRDGALTHSEMYLG